MTTFADTAIRKGKCQSSVCYVTAKNTYKWGFKRIDVIFEDLVFCNGEVSVLRDVTSCGRVPVFQTTQSHIPEDHQCTMAVSTHRTTDTENSFSRG
jgi:hypothetical protein